MRVKVVISSTIDGATESSVITSTIWTATLICPGWPVPSNPMFNRNGSELAGVVAGAAAGAGAAVDAAGVMTPDGGVWAETSDTKPVSVHTMANINPSHERRAVALRHRFK